MKDLSLTIQRKRTKNWKLNRELTELRDKTSKLERNSKEKTDSRGKLENLERDKLALAKLLEAQTRKWNVEREKLFAKIEKLQGELATQAAAPSQEGIQKYKELYERTQHTSQELLKQQKAQIYTLQLNLGTAKEELQKKKDFLYSFEQIEAKLVSTVKNKLNHISSLKTIIKHQSETVLMQEEDTLRYYNTKETLRKTCAKLSQYKSKYNQLELNVQLGATVSKDDPGLILINHNDPVFDKVQNPSHYKHSPSMFPELKPSPSVEPTSEQLDLTFFNLAAFKYPRPAFAAFLCVTSQAEAHELPFAN